MKSALTIFGLTSIALATNHASAQCQFLPGEGVKGLGGGPFNEGNVVLSVTTVGGPQLYIGGAFTVAGQEACRNLARWDGNALHDVGGGVGGTIFPNVSALATFNNELIVAGSFSEAGGVAAQSIARWNGIRWANLGNTDSVTIYEMLVFNGQLLVGGSFDTIGGVAAKSLATWNGTSWAELGGGVLDGTSPGLVYALALRADSVFVAGRFDTVGTTTVGNIARWNGTSWFALDGGLTGGTGVTSVKDLALFNNEIYAIGNFSDGGGFAIDDIARWDTNRWHEVGTPDSPGYALTVHNNELYMAGDADFSSNSGISRWDGTDWVEVPGGPFYLDINQLASHDGNLIAIGDFDVVDGKGARKIARYNGTNWFGFGAGSNAPVYEIGQYQGQPVAMGDFALLAGTDTDITARWDGAAWQPFAPGLYRAPNCSIEFNGFFVVGGSGAMTNVAGTDAIAAWNGAAWIPVGGGFGAFPAFPNVSALASYGGALYAAGSGLDLGAVTRNIAKFQGGVWVSVGDVNGPIYAMIVRNNALIVAGDFTSAGGVAVNNIAAFNGTTWSALGNGLSGPIFSGVYSLAEHDGLLIAGGDFNRSGAADMFGLASWNGSQWTNLGGATDNYVDHVFSHNDALYVAGTLIDPIFPNEYLARLSNGVWQDVDGGTDDYVSAFGTLGDDLLLGGEFGTAGGEVSAFLAQLHCSNVVGDTDGDGHVNIQDLANLLAHFGVCAPDPNYAANVDFDADNCVTIQDLALLLANFGT